MILLLKDSRKWRDVFDPSVFLPVFDHCTVVFCLLCLHPRGVYSLCDLNGDVRPDSVWFSECFVLNGVSISSLSVLNRVSLRDLMA